MGARALDEVSLVEIGNAMIVVAQQSGGSTEEELKRDALNLLGGKRITDSIDQRLQAALKRALEKGLLRRTSAGVIVNGEGG